MARPLAELNIAVDPLDKSDRLFLFNEACFGLSPLQTTDKEKLNSQALNPIANR